ncbi:J domain-containing protein [Caulobacter sp. 17J80-11]|uniref:J domain-containing protein n=1 Tax=Caulobacter sp. 17J80-11 TaxID=2763502 RepID=UPI001653EDD7|nr:J domain-containing protein [Caulobacter sp. 17J80-11]MBC6980487.1 J domain-containing protein [Caulobacter sp. 17J80-11]
MSGSADPYAVLGLTPDADAAQIRAAYLALARQHHPDRRAGGAGPSEDRIKEINAAFAVLGDARRRAAYDRAAQAAVVAAVDGVRPAVHRSPTEARRLASRRSRVIARGGAGAAGALVAVSVLAVAHANGLPRFSLAHFDARPEAEAMRANLAIGGGDAAPENVMLPWPGRGAQVRSGGLELSFEAARGDGGARLTVRDAGGDTVALSLPKDAELDGARYGVGRLDPDSRGASVVLAYRSRGEAGAQLKVAAPVDRGWKIVDLGPRPGAPLAVFPEEIDGDGVAEFVLPDARFLSVFGPPRQALFPPQILQVRAGQVVDVSDSGRFVAVFRADMEAARPICALGSNSACAAFVADAARVGRLEWAWSVMLQSYDRKAGWPLPSGCAAEAVPCPAGQGRRFTGYPAALEDFLRRSGYVRAHIDLGEEAPPVTPPASRAGAR